MARAARPDRRAAAAPRGSPSRGREAVAQSLRQADRMEAIGQLTGGIAHDFNNLLTVVIGGLEIIDRQVGDLGASPGARRIARASEMAMQGAQRAAAVTSRLLAFSRQQLLAPGKLDINALVSGARESLQAALGEALSLRLTLAARPWPLHADPDALRAALLNVALNARDAMPPGGVLTIETANRRLDEASARTLAETLPGGDYVFIGLTDTGAGMDRQAVERAFEPFFTTKTVGKGAGLGLSQVHGFVHQSAGHVRIDSRAGVGTTVEIYLPRYTERVRRRAAPRPAAQARAGGGETVLVVDDDEAVRAHSVEMLDELGYRTLQAADGAAALQVLAEAKTVDLLFTDVVMPGVLDGRQLAREAVRRRPDLKVLITTGFGRGAIVRHGRLDADVQLIGKPFSFQALAHRVRDILDAGGPAPPIVRLAAGAART